MGEGISGDVVDVVASKDSVSEDQRDRSGSSCIVGSGAMNIGSRLVDIGVSVVKRKW